MCIHVGRSGGVRSKIEEQLIAILSAGKYSSDFNAKKNRVRSSIGSGDNFFYMGFRGGHRNFASTLLATRPIQKKIKNPNSSNSLNFQFHISRLFS